MLGQSAADDAVAGTPWVGQPGVRETTAEIMAREEQVGSKGRAKKIKPRLRPDFQNLRQNPDSPNVPNWPPSAISSPTEPAAANPQTQGINFTGATLADTGAFPPR